ncbi:hypothetical protein [Mycolicibacter acidiphilus]|uniref:hypothetical protein n=1 Tax=Mycolicibacter acidiphilus TaxID=2835306 RepID=UPI001BD1DC51|nr:hypothetical protein [Mycolicibacter acidiphilus]
MRADVLTVSGDIASILDSRLAKLPGASLARNEHRPNGYHWVLPNGGKIRVFSSADQSPAGVTLHSNLPDDEHNTWAVEIFDGICAGSDGNVALLDEDDNVVKSRRQTAV